MAITCPKCGHHFIRSKGRTGPQPKVDPDLVVAGYLAGASVISLMERYEYSYARVYHILQFAGVELRRGRGSRQSKVTLSAQKMKALYAQGKSLEQIGAIAGCTREWVRQVLKALGVTRQDGGRYVATLGKKEARRAALLDGYKKRRGFTLEYRREMSEKYSFNGQDPYRVWERKRNNILRDGTTWDISFPEWMDLWIASGKLPEYGRGRDAYCASRIDDDGSWTIGNLRIVQFGELVREMRAKEKAQGRGMYAHLATL